MMNCSSFENPEQYDMQHHDSLLVPEEIEEAPLRIRTLQYEDDDAGVDEYAAANVISIDLNRYLQ